MGHSNISMTLNCYAPATFHSAHEEMDRLKAKAEINVVNTEKTEAAAYVADRYFTTSSTIFDRENTRGYKSICEVLPI